MFRAWVALYELHVKQPGMFYVEVYNQTLILWAGPSKALLLDLS